MSGIKRNDEEEFTIPSFYGKIHTIAYIEWEKKMEFLFGLQYYTEKKKVCLAVTGLCGSALSWWQRVSQTRRFKGRPQINSWVEMKTLMKKRFVLQWELPELKPKSGTKLIVLDQFRCWSELPSKLAERRSVVPDLSLKQKEEKLQHSLVASQIELTEESRQGELELTTLCLKQEEEAQVECDHVPDEKKEEERVVVGSSEAPELVFSMVDQRDNFKTLSCDLLIRPMVCLQFSLMGHLRAVKGLQQVVFEPGGILCMFRRSNKTLDQKAAAFKLDLQSSFTLEEHDLWSNPFEGIEDGVIQTSYSENEEDLGGNTSLISSITDQNKLRRPKQKLVGVKEKPKLKIDYGDFCTRPPDHMESFRQYKIGRGHDGLKDVTWISILGCNGLVQPPEWHTGFFGDLREPLIFSVCSKSTTHADDMFRDKDKKRVCWIEVQELAGRPKVNKGMNMCSLSDICKGNTSMDHLRHVKGLEHFVFEPGGEANVESSTKNTLSKGTIAMELIVYGLIFLQSLDLRTNPFEGREYGAILRRLKIKAWDPMYWPANLLIKAWLNGQFQSLTGMIYEVLDREKRRCLGTTRNGEVSDGKLKLFKLDESRSDSELDESEENELIEPEQGDKGAFGGTINNPENISNVPELNLSYGDQFTRLSGPLEQGKQLRKVLGWARI